MKRNNRTADEIRLRLGLTQEMMAYWLGVGRSSVSLAERGHQPPTMGATTAIQSVRLSFAAAGQVYDGAGGHAPAPPALPAPAPDAGPVESRLAQCQHQLGNLRFALGQLRDRARPYEARLVAAALRAWLPPSPIGAEYEAIWLRQFEQEAQLMLERYGVGPQKLLEARIAGLAHEVQLLEGLLADYIPNSSGAV